MPNMYTNIRRKSGESLESITITLPKDVLVELENHGVESGRGGGNMSVFLETSSLVTMGIFHAPSSAVDALDRLVRVDLAKSRNLQELAENLEVIATLLRERSEE